VQIPPTRRCAGATRRPPGLPLSGDYRNLTVSGIAYVDTRTTLNVSGSLKVCSGACLGAFSLGAVHVGHNVLVNPEATLATDFNRCGEHAEPRLTEG
jgi:hypothetical protein